MKKSDLDNLLHRAVSFSRENDSDAVLFLGQPTDPLPRALLFDKDLPPWARIIWWCLRTYSDNPASASRAPSYENIQEELGIGSRGTVSAAIHSLRVTRWITLLANSDVRRNVYLLHDAPLTFSQAIELDPDYTDRIADALRSSNKHVRQLARRVLDGAMETAESDNPCSELYRLASVPSRHGNPPDGAHVFEWGDFNLRGSPPEQEMDLPLPEEPKPVELDFHELVLGLTPGMERLARIKLEEFPSEQRQALLDDLAVRVLEQADGDNPVRNSLAYIMWTVNRYVQDKDLALDGRGRRLPELLQAMEFRQRSDAEKPLRDELVRLSSNHQGLERMISRSGSADPSMLDQLTQTERRMTEIRKQLEGAGHDVH